MPIVLTNKATKLVRIDIDLCSAAVISNACGLWRIGVDDGWSRNCTTLTSLPRSPLSSLSSLTSLSSLCPLCTYRECPPSQDSAGPDCVTVHIHSGL